MCRRLLNILTALSLLLCVATVALLARSYVVSDRFTRMTLVHDGTPDGDVEMPRSYHLHENWWYVYPDSGELTVMHFYWADAYRADGFGWQWKRWKPRHESHQYTSAFLRWIGVDIAFEGDSEPRNNSHQMVVVPLWLMAAAFAVLPGTRVAAKLRRRRWYRHGLCAACGYDLRATPGRCPECGAAAAGTAV